MTKLILNIIDYEENLLFNAIKLKISGEEVKVTSNKITIDISYHYKYYTDYYTEIIQLYNSQDNKIMKEYRLELYFNQSNIYDIILNSKNNFSFDILIYSNNTNLLPNEIKYKYNNNLYSIREYNSFGIKRIRKFGLINCEKSWFINLNDIHFPSYIIKGSYYINIFLKEKANGEKITKTSICKIYLNNFKTIDFNLIDEKVQEYFINFPDKINEIYETTKDLEDIPHKPFYFSINANKLKREVIETQYNELKILEDLLFKKIDLNLNEKEYKICFGYCLYLFTYSVTSIAFCYVIYENLISYINKFNGKIKGDLDILRFILWYRDCILKKEELLGKFIDGILDLIIKNNENNENNWNFNGLEPFKVLLFDESGENTPYNLAIKFLENFINNLNEESFIFEILFFIDSEVSTNRQFKYCRMFKLSMLSLAQIKQHLLLLIPKIMIIIDRPKKDSSNATLLTDNGIISIYEGNLFKIGKDLYDFNIMNNKDDQVKYTIPIILLFLHECFCCSKIRKRFSEIDSPSYFYNPYDDYKLVFHSDKGECGRLFEFYISPNIEVIKFLKYSYASMPELLNTEYWTSSNREKLWRYINQKMEENKIEILEKLDNFPTNLIEAKPQFADKRSDYEADIYYSDNSEDESKFKNRMKRKKKKVINCQ